MNGGFSDFGGRSIKRNNGSPPGPWDGYVCHGDLSLCDMWHVLLRTLDVYILST